MTTEKKNNAQSAIYGVLIGVAILIGGKMLDSVLGTDKFDKIEQKLDQINDKITDVRLNYVKKSEYDNDKRDMINLVKKGK